MAWLGVVSVCGHPGIVVRPAAIGIPLTPFQVPSAAGFVAVVCDLNEVLRVFGILESAEFSLGVSVFVPEVPIRLHATYPQ